MTGISSADFTKMTLQEVADFLLDQDVTGVRCLGEVDGKLYKLCVKMEVCEYDRRSL